MLLPSNLGVMYANGRGVPQSDTEAAAWWRKAAEQGHVSAQNELGVMYANGRGVAKDENEAVTRGTARRLRKAMLLPSNLGVMYANGRGVPQSDTEAAAWWRKAAEQGDATAQHKTWV